MIKQAPKPLQIVAMVTFVMACVGVLLYLWLSFGGVIPLRSEGYRIQVQFPEAVQLAEQSDVRISGVPVGKVVKIEPGPENTTEATLEMRSRYAPVPKNARAMLRQKSLLGETYVDLTVGDRTQGVIPDGGSLARTSVHETVELDEIFRTFDDDTQQAFQVWMQSQASAVNGRAADINATFGTFPGFVEASDDILAELHAQERAVSDTIRGTGKFFSALSERDGQLSRLITESNRLFQTIAGRNQDFAAIWRELPEFSRQSRLTLPRLTRFAENADPVVQALQPAATEFAGTFNELDKLAPEFRGFFEGLGPVITKSEKGVPALESLLQDFPPLLAEFEPFLQNFNPILAHLGQNRREITSFFGNVTASSNGWNLNLNRDIRDVDRIHYLRATQTLNPSSLAYYPRTLGQTRANAFMAPGGLDRLASGLASFETSQCGNGDPAPPAQTGSPELVELARLATDFAFKPTGDRNVPRPPCVAQGNYPGFDTQYPQIRAEP